jgi:putative nucleotidyltransferase with HDIG domain
MGTLRSLAPQPLTGTLAAAGALACIALFAKLGSSQVTSAGSWQTLLLAAVLCVVTTASALCPIHLRHNMKLYMATVPLFILAATARPIEAAIFAFVGVCGRELLARGQTGAYLSDVLATASIGAVNVMLASGVAHANVVPDHAVSVLISAAFYLVIEAVTLPIFITPVSGELPWRVVAAFVQSAAVPDAIQLGVAVLGAIVAPAHAWALILIGIPAYFIYTSFKATREIHEHTREILARLADTVDLRDTYTGGHSRRVAELTASILAAMGKRGKENELVVWAARVHDIGKIGIPDSVLLKEGKLDLAEQAIMETHPDKGAEFLRQHREFARGVEVVRHHHERWDGLGYPARLHGQAIPWGARIVAVADSFDAMTSDRPYRKGLSINRAREILVAGSGTQWDPEVVAAFLGSGVGAVPHDVATTTRMSRLAA